MNSTLDFNIADQLCGIVPHVFETMIAAAAVTSPNGAPLPPTRISGTVGIAGEFVTGAVYLHLPEAFARQATETIMMCPAGQVVSDSDINDVVGELTNMIGGSLRSALGDLSRECAISTPSIIRGAFGVEAPQGVRSEKIQFVCMDHHLVVEVYLQLN